MQLRILNSRSATVSQYLSSCGIGRRAEVLRGHAEHRRGAAGVGTRVDAERPPHLQVLEPHFEVREQVRAPWRIFWNVSGSCETIGGIFSGRGPEDVGGEDVDLRRFLDRLHRVAPEQLVAPLDEVVDVLHHHRLLIGGDAKPGDHVRRERLLPPGRQLTADLVLALDELRCPRPVYDSRCISSRALSYSLFS